MRDLSATLLAAQKSVGVTGDAYPPIWKIVLSLTGQTTRGYDTSRVIRIKQIQEDDSQTAQVILDNSDNALKSINFEKYQGVIGVGYNTGVARSIWVKNTAYTAYVKGVSAASVVTPTTTTGYQYRCVVAGTSHATTEPTWQTSLGVTQTDGTVTWEMDGYTSDEYSNYPPLKVESQEFLSGQGVMQVSLFLTGKPNQMGQDKAESEYKQESGDTNVVSTLINAVAQKTMTPYASYASVATTYDSGYDDSIIDALKPADYFRVGFNDTRLDKIKELLAYTACKMRAEDDGALHILNPMTTTLVDQSYITGDDSISYVYGDLKLAQTFTPSFSHYIASVKLELCRVGIPGTLYVGIKATTAGRPTGNDLCSGTTDGDTLTTNTAGEWREITFSTGYNLVAGTKYAIVIYLVGGGATDCVYWRYDNAGAYAGGTAVIYSSGAWDIYSDIDWMFEESADYDYEYKLAVAGFHTFFSKNLRLRFVNPNKEIVVSHPDHLPQYTGSSTSAASYALDPKIHTTRLRLASNAQAALIAAAKIEHNELSAERGSIKVPMNVGQEVWDYILVTDQRQGDTRTGNVQYLEQNINNGRNGLTWDMTLRFGKVSGGMPAIFGESETGGPPNWSEMQDLINRLIDKVNEVAGKLNSLSDGYHLEEISRTLDDVLDGATYERVLATDITAGHILLTEATGSLDSISDGATYTKLLATDIAAGHIKLTTAVTSAGKWYDTAGVSIDAANGIIIYGSATAFRTRATYGGTDQCYMDSAGAICAGAGAVKLDASGIAVKGQYLKIQDTDGVERGVLYGAGGEIPYCVLYAPQNLLLSTAGLVGIDADLIPVGSIDFGSDASRWLTAYITTLSATESVYIGIDANGYIGALSDAPRYLFFKTPDGAGGGSAFVPERAAHAGVGHGMLGDSNYYWEYVISQYFLYKTAPYAFQSHDDLGMIKAMKPKLGSKNKNGIDQLDFATIPDEVKFKEKRKDTGEIEEFIDHSAMTGLLIGAVRQLIERVEKLEK